MRTIKDYENQYGKIFRDHGYGHEVLPEGYFLVATWTIDEDYKVISVVYENKQTTI
jgi:hypothetical protein